MYNPLNELPIPVKSVSSRFDGLTPTDFEVAIPAVYVLQVPPAPVPTSEPFANLNAVAVTIPVNVACPFVSIVVPDPTLIPVNLKRIISVPDTGVPLKNLRSV